MKYESVLAEPLSRVAIRQIVTRIRSLVGLTDDPYFPIVNFIEHVMPDIYEGFSMEIVPVHEMPKSYAEALPQLNIMRIREDVYNNAVNDIGRDRFTLAHEVGHFILHNSDRVALARVESGQDIPAYIKPEWQANTFAGELLVPVQFASSMSAECLSDVCSVSFQVSEIQKRYV